jgi:hypothetical protein
VTDHPALVQLAESVPEHEPPHVPVCEPVVPPIVTGQPLLVIDAGHVATGVQLPVVAHPVALQVPVIVPVHPPPQVPVTLAPVVPAIETGQPLFDVLDGQDGIQDPVVAQPEPVQSAVIRPPQPHPGQAAGLLLHVPDTPRPDVEPMATLHPLLFIVEGQLKSVQLPPPLTHPVPTH